MKKNIAILLLLLTQFAVIQGCASRELSKSSNKLAVVDIDKKKILLEKIDKSVVRVTSEGWTNDPPRYIQLDPLGKVSFHGVRGGGEICYFVVDKCGDAKLDTFVAQVCNRKYSNNRMCFNDVKFTKISANNCVDTTTLSIDGCVEIEWDVLCGGVRLYTDEEWNEITRKRDK